MEEQHECPFMENEYGSVVCKHRQITVSEHLVEKYCIGEYESCPNYIACKLRDPSGEGW